MIPTLFRRDDAPTLPAPLFDDTTELLDPLTGVVPTWRLDEEPVYLEVVRDLGSPWLPSTQALDLSHLADAVPVVDVIAGEVLDDPPVVDPAAATEPIPLVVVPTQPIPRPAIPLTGRGGRKRRAPRARARREAGAGELWLVAVVVVLVALVGVGVGRVADRAGEVRDDVCTSRPTLCDATPDPVPTP